MRSLRMLWAPAALSILVAACGEDSQTSAQSEPTTKESESSDCPEPTEERIRAVARTGERLRAETLPEGFALTSGDENPGRGAELTYAKPGEPGGPRVQLGRRLSSEPAERFIAPDGISRQEIRGHPGVVAESGTGSEFRNVAWHETPDVVVIVTTYRLGRDETVRVAEGVRYEPGTAGETVAVMPADAPAGCRALPPHALSRAEIVARFPDSDVETKLVRLAQVTAADSWAGICIAQPCTDGLVAWVALRQGPPGSFPHSYPPGAPPEAGVGSWELSIIDASGGGVGYGTSIGDGAAPPEFAAWDDLAP